MKKYCKNGIYYGDTKQDIQEIKPLFFKSVAIAEKWMLRYLAEENIIGSNIPDPVSFYKWPLTLAARGREPEASDLLGWINKNCLTEDGDYLSDRSGFHREFHIYSALWMVLADIKTYEIKLGKKEECYYFLGAACFLAKWIRSNFGAPA